jgi:recombinational DNA repair protein (RecF pathway)
MREFITDAVVLHKEPLRDADARYFFFTKRQGKVVGKATSARKVTSKLAGHLEPGTLTAVRFIERNGGGIGTQVVDALKDRALQIPLTDLRLLNAVLHEGEADITLWNELLQGQFSWKNILRILGWDPVDASCAMCGGKVAYFYIPRQEFFCKACASKLGQSELILLLHEQL